MLLTSYLQGKSTHTCMFKADTYIVIDCDTKSHHANSLQFWCTPHAIGTCCSCPYPFWLYIPPNNSCFSATVSTLSTQQEFRKGTTTRNKSNEDIIRCAYRRCECHGQVVGVHLIFPVHGVLLRSYVPGLQEAFLVEQHI